MFFSYQKRIDEIADALEDEPIKSLDKIIFWTEYVIKHKGAKFLKYKAGDIPLYQYLLLDVIFFALVLFICVLYVLYKLSTYLIRRRNLIKIKVGYFMITLLRIPYMIIKLK